MSEEIISPNLRSLSNRHIRYALAMFWIKLKTNLSFLGISVLSLAYLEMVKIDANESQMHLIEFVNV